jgi:hypothetical protein
MSDHLNNSIQRLARLSSPLRNHFFYGKLLTEKDLTLEQTYMNRKRWLLNRLGLGSGVLCGLEVQVSADGERLLIQPGVAVDPFGREIIVPEAYCLENPRQPTDCMGRPQGDLIQGKGLVHICVAYHECEVNAVPVLVADCDTRQDCAANHIRERYRVAVCVDSQVHTGLPEEQCRQIFPAEKEEGFVRWETACRVLSGACAAPEEECVVIAAALLPEDPEAPIQVQVCEHRRMIYSNGALFDLLMCLADRVDECCGQTQVMLLLKYVEGDAQTAAAGSVLPGPLVVQVVDSGGQTIANEPVTFRVRGGGGSVLDASNNPQAQFTLPSDTNGLAKVAWQIGPNAGLNTLEASIASGAQVVFSALGQLEVSHPPVITDYTPGLGADMDSGDLKRFFEEGFELFFDREMNSQDLENPEQWLALWFVGPLDPAAPPGQGPAVGIRAELMLADPNPAAPSASARYKFAIEITIEELVDRGFRGLLAAYAAGNTIRGEADGVLLDADFAGTILDFQKTGLYPKEPGRSLLDIVFKLPAHQRLEFRPELYDGLQTGAGPSLPSGDGTPGGIFSSWFGIR